MSKEKIVMIAVAIVVAFILCGVGILFLKKDLFAALSHPLAKKYPNISKRFGTVFICFAIVWLAGTLLAII